MRDRRSTVLGIAVAAVLVVGSLLLDEHIGDALRRVFAQLPPVLLPIVVVAVGLAALAYELARRRRRRLAGVPRPRTAPPAGLALPVIVGVAAALQISLNEAVSMPRVFGDELIFTNLAKSFAATGELVVRGVTDNGHSVLYPVLISPAYALAGDGVEAFHAVQVVNSLVMASTAVPAYFLARRVVSQNWSLGVAGLSVLVPATSYSALVMTESLFYPAFATAALVLTLMLERPTLARQLAAAGLLVTLVAVRTQALLLVPATATAIGVHALRSESARARATAFWPTWVVLALVAAGGLVASQVGADAPTGAYGSLLRPYDALELGKWAAWNAGAFMLGLGVVALGSVPLALSRLLRREAGPREHAFGSATAALLLWLLASVAVLSASPYGLDILHERSLFFATPLVLACFTYWLAQGPVRTRGLSIAVAVVLVGLAALLPERLVLTPATVDAPTNVIWIGLDDRIGAVPPAWFLVAAACLGAAVLVFARTATLPLLSLVLAIVFVTANLQWRAPLTRAQTERLGWIDRQLPDGAKATIVHVAVESELCPAGTDTYQGEAVAWTEFFNKSVDRVYGVLGEVRDDGLATPQLTIDPDGRLLRDGAPLAPDYAVVDSRVRIVGTELATLNLHDFPGFDTTKPGSLTLWHPEQPLRVVFPGPLRDGQPELLACPAAVNQ